MAMYRIFLIMSRQAKKLKTWNYTRITMSIFLMKYLARYGIFRLYIVEIVYNEEKKIARIRSRSPLQFGDCPFRRSDHERRNKPVVAITQSRIQNSWRVVARGQPCACERRGQSMRRVYLGSRWLGWKKKVWNIFAIVSRGGCESSCLYCKQMRAFKWFFFS